MFSAPSDDQVKKTKEAARARFKEDKEQFKKLTNDNITADYYQGLGVGRLAAFHGQPKRTQFANESPNFYKGYTNGYDAKRKEMSPDEFNFNRGKYAGNIDRNDKKGKLILLNEDEAYKKGYEEGYTEQPTSVEANVNIIEKKRDAESEDDYKKGYRGGKTAASLGRLMKNPGKNKSQAYRNGFLDGYQAKRNTMTTEEFEFKRGEIAARRTQYSKPATLHLELKSDDYRRGFQEGCRKRNTTHQDDDTESSSSEASPAPPAPRAKPHKKPKVTRGLVFIAHDEKGKAPKAAVRSQAILMSKFSVIANDLPKKPEITADSENKDKPGL